MFVPSDVTVPSWLTPLPGGGSLGPVKVERDAQIRKTKDGEPETKPEYFPGRFAYRFQVSLTVGQVTRDELDENGEMKTYTTPDKRVLPVTVWSTEPVSVVEGDIVSIEFPLLGAIDGRLYVQGFGVRSAATADALSRIFDEEDSDDE